MNPQIHSRWGLLCPSCEKKLINPNQPWPQPCTTCGQRTHVKCLSPHTEWLVDLDVNLNPNQTAIICVRCRMHAQRNRELIERIPHATGTLPIDIYRAWKAKQPSAPTKTVSSLWGPYRVDPDNFVPAVTKVLDIVHSAGPKVRWAVKLGAPSQIPMTNLSSKEIILPNYFDSPEALGKTHQEILDAMTGAAMHEAGHAAYDSADTIREAQRRIKAGPGESTWASSTCLNIVCDYNLERKVIERYPAFKHYFSECYRWSTLDVLPGIVNTLKLDGSEDKMNVRLAVLTWEMLGPGELERAGGQISPKLTFIIKKCFDILKYAYTRGYLNREDGKLKTARAIYELVKVITPVGYQPPMILPPQPPSQQGQQPPDVTSGFPGQPQPGNQGQPGQQPGQGQPQDSDDDSQQQGEPQETDDDLSDADGDEGSLPASEGDPGRAGEGGDDQPGDQEGSGELQEEAQGESEASGSEGQGDRDSDDDGTGSDSDGDGEATGSGTDTGTSGTTGGDQEGSQEEDAQGADDDDRPESSSNPGRSDEPGNPDNTGPETGDAGQTGLNESGMNQGGKSGTEIEADPADDPFTGAGDLKDDPTRRSNSKKDALDDLAEENAGEQKLNERYEQDLTNDRQFETQHRTETETLSNPPNIQHREVPKDPYLGLEPAHQSRVKELAPVISRLKKILRFRNADWGGKQTGRRSGTLTRRHVSRLSAFGSDKVFHKTKPDETPKVRIGLLVDESESMRSDGPGKLEPYIGARNAATALIGALHGIRGVKLWCWGFSLHGTYLPGRSTRVNIPEMRQYADPYNATSPAGIELSPMFGGTPTGEAMDHAAEVLHKNASPDEKVVIFIITDGEAGGFMSTATAVRKWWGKVTFVHIGIGHTVDPSIPFYVGPVTDISILPDLLSESVSEILR